MNNLVRDELSPELKEIYDNMIMPVNNNIKLEQVILSKENKEKIQRFKREIDKRAELLKFGLEPMNRVLLHGASGTGKTFMVKALSNEINFTMLYVDISRALSEGNVAQNVSDIFRLANELGDCIIFLDECDSVAWRRDDANNNDSADIRRATNSIFQNLDQMNSKCIFVAATNMLHRIDPAFERRFNMKMKFTRPTLDIDEAVRHFMYQKFKIVDDVETNVREIVKRRASQNAKLSYYEIEEITKEGMKRAVLNDSNEVHLKDIYEDLQVSMHFKVRHKTGTDDAEIFRNKLNYEPDIDETEYY